ncbi:MAG: phospholipase D family protein [Planctomycetota bacterium]|nr:phospholipase D family protein [Planctomycetota bacterium]
MLTPMGYVVLGMGVTGGLGLSMVCARLMRLLGPKVRHEAYFSPSGGITEAILQNMAKARREILLQGFTLHSRPIAEALVAAKNRGVHVEILLDSITEKDSTSDLNYLIESGMEPQIDGNHGLAHNKIVIIDNKTLITGSFNFTRQAEEENAENIIVVEGVPHLIHTYREAFLVHKAHSRASLRAGGIPQAALPQTIQARPQTQPLATQMPQSRPNAPIQQPNSGISGMLNNIGNSSTPSVAASLANMGLHGQGSGQTNPPATQYQALHQGHGQVGMPQGFQNLQNSQGVVTSPNGNQVTPEMLRAMVQNAANART